MNISIEEAKEIAARIAPELAGLEVFQCTEEMPRPPGARAFATSGFYLPLRDELERAGRWRGAWPQAVFFCQQPEPGLLLHELAHTTPARPPLPDTLGNVTATDRNYLSARIAADSVTAAAGVPWAGHGPRFIRRALHLHYRATEIGLDVRLESMQVAGPAYGLSMPACYEEAIGHEPRSMARKSFAEIDSTPLPHYFDRLWRQDVISYFNELALDALNQEEKSL